MRLYRDRVIEAAADLLRRNAAFREDVVLIKSHAREDPAKFEPAVTSVPGNRLRLAPPDVDPFELGLRPARYSECSRCFWLKARSLESLR